MCVREIWILSLLACVARLACAEPTGEVIEGRYVLTVPEGETYRMTASDDGILPTNTFTPSERVRKAHWCLVQEGNTLTLVSGRGLTLILR